MHMRWLFLALLALAVVHPAGFTETVVAQDDRAKLAGAGGASGIGQYPPKQWGVAATTINNPTGRDQSLRVTLSFDDSKNLEFATDVWIPARSRRRVWLPIRTNQFSIEPFKTQTLPLTQRLYDLSGTASGGEPTQLHELQGLLIATRDNFITGMLADGNEKDENAVRVGLAARQVMDYSRRMAYLRANDLPSMVAGWRGLNSLILSKDTPGLDPAQLAAMRQWLLAGGRLWVMAEQVDASFMRRLLGDEWTLQVVDHVPLTRVRMLEDDRPTEHTITIDDDGALTLNGEEIGVFSGPKQKWKPLFEKLNSELRPLLPSGSVRSRPAVLVRAEGAASGEMVHETVQAVQGAAVVLDRAFEKPVDMARVLAPDMEVMATVNGWPAAMRKRIGDGWLMVTTVGPRAFMEPVLTNQINVDGTERRNNEGLVRLQDGNAATKPLESLASWFMRDERNEPLPSVEFDAFVSNKIGREIVGKTTIVFVLGGYLLALLIGGLWLRRAGHLERIVAVGVTGALVATVILLLVGRAKRAAVPSTVAHAQFIQIAPGQQHAVVNGWMQVYNPGLGEQSTSTNGGRSDFDSDNAHFEATAGGLILPGNLDELGSRRVSMVWSDLDRWQWRNVTLPSGQSRSASFEHAIPLNQPVHAIATFDEQGIVGKLQVGQLGAMESLLIATPTGHLATTLSADGAFRATMKDQLPDGQYHASNVLSNVQQQQQAVFKQLLSPVQEETLRTTTKSGERPSGQKPAPRNAKTKRQGLDRIDYPRQPTLLAWANPIALGFEVPQVEQTLGSALVAIPLEFERPAVGARVAIPSALIAFEPIRGRGSISPYDKMHRRWLPLTTGGTARIEFTPPSILHPLKLESATFTVDLVALQRKMTVRALTASKPITLKTQESPNGKIEIAVPATIQPDARGVITIELTVDETAGTDQSTWHVRSVGLDLQATIKAEDD